MPLMDETIQKIAPQDQGARERAKARLNQLTMPHWALGRLMDIAVELAGITGNTNPTLVRRLVVIMAGDHGVVDEGVSKYPPEVTGQMVANFVSGGAGVNAIARVVDASVLVVDMGCKADLHEFVEQGAVISKKISDGTGNITKGPAMTRDQAVAAVEAGIEIAEELSASVDLFATGEMGIGNTTPSSAMVSAFTGLPPSDVTGRGAGLNEEQVRTKIDVVQRSLDKNRPNPKDAIDVLAKVGGFEIAGLAGLILGAAAKRKPVLVDGFIATAGALVAQGLAPLSGQYMIAAHKSVEPGHKLALKRLGKQPLLDLNMRLGEGAGACLAMSLIEASMRVLTEVSTFEEAAVSLADK
jgi:nicotinate-nucleotide--dimethylbenzimidazole phosphoribosyltransferase